MARKPLSENLALLEMWLRSNGRDALAGHVAKAVKIVKVLEERDNTPDQGDPPERMVM